MALFSCRLTQALRPSALTVMYSGSRSCAALAPGPNTRTPAGSSTPSKPMVATGSTGRIGTTVTTLTLPTGSVQPSP